MHVENLKIVFNRFIISAEQKTHPVKLRRVSSSGLQIWFRSWVSAAFLCFHSLNCGNTRKQTRSNYFTGKTSSSFCEAVKSQSVLSEQSSKVRAASKTLKSCKVCGWMCCRRTWRTVWCSLLRLDWEQLTLEIKPWPCKATVSRYMLAGSLSCHASLVTYLCLLQSPG